MNDYSPSDITTDANGYRYDETSTFWKTVCSDLPCNREMAWTGYETTELRVTTKSGKNVVIQCWKGFCADAVPPLPIPGFQTLWFPGGQGAEVGVYEVDDAKSYPPSAGDIIAGIEADLPGVPLLALAAYWKGVGAWLNHLGYFPSSSEKHWWPAPDAVVSEVSFTLKDRFHGDVLIDSYSTQTYWTCKWMHPLSYASWTLTWMKNHDTFRAPLPTDFDLEFTFDGLDYLWAAGTATPTLAPAAVPAAALASAP